MPTFHAPSYPDCSFTTRGTGYAIYAREHQLCEKGTGDPALSISLLYGLVGAEGPVSYHMRFAGFGSIKRSVGRMKLLGIGIQYRSKIAELETVLRKNSFSLRQFGIITARNGNGTLETMFDELIAEVSTNRMLAVFRQNRSDRR